MALVKTLPAMQETRVQSLGLKDPLEKEMATHSSILALKISWTEKPGSTPVVLPGESQGQGSLMGCRLWGRTESDTTEVT